MKRAELKTVPNRSPQGKQNFLSRDSLFRTEEAFTILLSKIVRSGQTTAADLDAQSLQIQQFLSGPAAGTGETLFGQIPILDIYNLLMVAFTVIALAGLVYLGTTQVVNPLLQPNKIPRGLADGNFTLRAKVDRQDEIGQLADSMNRLGNELTNLSSTMAGKVEQCTAQLKTASEIATTERQKALGVTRAQIYVRPVGQPNQNDAKPNSGTSL